MSAFRIIFILCFAILSTNFNSAKWAEESVHQINLPNCPSEDGVHLVSGSHVKVKAVTVTVNLIKCFTILDEASWLSTKTLSQKLTLRSKWVNSVALFCAIKSYLHLLQKF